MSWVEWLAVAAAAVVAIIGLRTPRPSLTLVVVVVAGALLLLGTPRWQLVPAAVGLLVLGGVAASQVLGEGAGGTTPGWAAGVAATGLALTALLAWALPIPSLELADDSRPVGSVAFDLVDPSRTSPVTGDDSPRLTPVQAWFPTDRPGGPRLRVTDEPVAFAGAVSRFLGIPTFALTHLGQVRTAAVTDAPPVDQRLPVVVSLHGWGGFRFAQAPLLEQLAADGHLVLALDHTGGSLAAQPVDGGVVPLDPSLLPSDAPPAEYDAAARSLERTFADDARNLIKAVRSGDGQVPPEVLAAADLDRLVVLGHSTGGGAAALLCAEEPCDAMVLFDPWVEPVPPDVRADGFAAPTLAVVSGAWDGIANDALLRPMVDASDRARRLVLAGTTHNDVTVQARLSPLASRLGIAGSIPSDRLEEIVLALTRSWLVATGGTGPGDASLVEAPPFPEVRTD